MADPADQRVALHANWRTLDADLHREGVGVFTWVIAPPMPPRRQLEFGAIVLPIIFKAARLILD